MSIIALPSASQAPLKFICSACGADRGCQCDAPAIEKLAQKQEQDRQRAKTYRERKAEENQHPRHVTDQAGFEDDTFEPDENVEEPRQVLMNVLDTINQHRAVAEAYRKLLKRSPFDRGAKKEISDAIESLIRKWGSVQSTLAMPPPQRGAAA
jgi:uncharacterized coiled-coil DUF342 family protein